VSKTRSGGKKYPTSQLPLKRKSPPRNIEDNQGDIEGEIGTFKPRWKPSALKWERVNEVTYKLAVEGKVSHTPPSQVSGPASIRAIQPHGS
jgi:hypothetical protein